MKSFLRDKDLDKNNFELWRLFKEIQGPPEVILLSRITHISQTFVEISKNVIVMKVLSSMTQWEQEKEVKGDCDI